MTQPRFTILVVDDDADILETVSLVLDGPDFQVATARDGEAALDRLRRDGTVRLILLDMMMPTMDGWSFRAKQLADPRIAGIPVVVLTGDGRAKEKAKDVQAAAYLRKPFALEDLLDTVARFCPKNERSAPESAA